MTPGPGLILTLNAGSSSVKFAVFEADAAGGPPAALCRGQLEGIDGGTAGTARLRVSGDAPVDRALPQVRGHADALAALIPWIAERFAGRSVRWAGHRMVHGGPDFFDPVAIDDAVVARLDALSPFAPLHQPRDLAVVAAARKAFPAARHYACFDTAFHRTQPRVHETFALPERYYDIGIRRYGFHGLSYAHVARVLAAEQPALLAGRVVVAHLGNGASVCGMLGGRSLGCSMGFSPVEGMVMGTRSGQLDPGVMLYLMEAEGLGPAEISDLVHSRSGLAGLSGLSNDIRVLEAAAQAGHERAARALHHFVCRAAREIAAMAGMIGGIDGLVFTGGIGEHAAAVRGRIAVALGWTGLAFDPAANRAGGPVLSQPGSRVRALVMRADEESTIALAARRFPIRASLAQEA